ncbi:hypothetical protein JD844_021301 [Phrynosoma platyrhinos]|uniref:Uncharacterized protein n=1 Tax=Phrynosoma platyrhinos TaxID=52577 RepID=A0ABQ7STI0_PHRPL|nr:hypothetical protein JD844_021301 [Phrynosoma platyrhinos]
MSCTDLHSKTADIPIYISTVEVMLSSSRVATPPTSKPAVQETSFRRMPPAEILSDSDWYFPAHLPPTETLPRNDILPPHCLSSEVYSSRLDIILAHSNKGKDLGRDQSCVNPSGIKAACSTLHKGLQCNGYSNAGVHSSLISCKQYSGSGCSGCHSSTVHADPVQFAVPFPSATASRGLPCWISRLDVSLCAIPESDSSSQSKTTHAALPLCNSEPRQHSYNHCSAQPSDLHASVKLYISTCSIAIKPFRAASQTSNHAYSSLLLPHLNKISTGSSSHGARPQMTHQAIPSRSPTDLQITRFHITSTDKCPDPHQQTVSREIWLSPTTMTKGDSPFGKRTIQNTHLDPDMIVFQNHHSTGEKYGKTSSTGIIPGHHKISKITLILATPWTTLPIKVIKEFQKNSAPSIFVKTQGSNLEGPNLQTDCIGSGFSLSINPVCCPEFQPSRQGARSEPKPFQEPGTVGETDQATPLTNMSACTTNAASHKTGESKWCPSISVKIASFGAGRKVVKISIPF